MSEANWRARAHTRGYARCVVSATAPRTASIAWGCATPYPAMAVFADFVATNTLLRIGVIMVLMVPMDLLCQRTGKTRWLLLHSLVNGIICYFSFSDVPTVMSRPLLGCVGRPGSELPAESIVALHTYHLLFFECSRADWIHHICFVSVLGFLCLYYDGGPLVNAVSFFICGLPGGLDMLLVVLVKHGYLTVRPTAAASRILLDELCPLRFRHVPKCAHRPNCNPASRPFVARPGGHREGVEPASQRMVAFSRSRHLHLQHVPVGDPRPRGHELRAAPMDQHDCGRALLHQRPVLYAAGHGQHLSEGRRLRLSRWLVRHSKARMTRRLYWGFTGALLHTNRSSRPQHTGQSLPDQISRLEPNQSS